MEGSSRRLLKLQDKLALKWAFRAAVSLCETTLTSLARIPAEEAYFEKWFPSLNPASWFLACLIKALNSFAVSLSCYEGDQCCPYWPTRAQKRLTKKPLDGFMVTGSKRVHQDAFAAGMMLLPNMARWGTASKTSPSGVQLKDCITKCQPRIDGNFASAMEMMQGNGRSWENLPAAFIYYLRYWGLGGGGCHTNYGVSAPLECWGRCLHLEAAVAACRCLSLLPWHCW